MYSTLRSAEPHDPPVERTWCRQRDRRRAVGRYGEPIVGSSAADERPGGGAGRERLRLEWIGLAGAGHRLVDAVPVPARLGVYGRQTRHDIVSVVRHVPVALLRGDVAPEHRRQVRESDSPGVHEGLPRRDVRSSLLIRQVAQEVPRRSAGVEDAVVAALGYRSRTTKRPPRYDCEFAGVSSCTAVVNSRPIFLFLSTSAGAAKFATSAGYTNVSNRAAKR